MEGERERDPELAIKTKDTLVVRGARKTGEVEAQGSGGHAVGLVGKGQDSQREGQNDRQEQGHRLRNKAEEREGGCEDTETGRERGEKTHKARETEKWREQSPAG